VSREDLEEFMLTKVYRTTNVSWSRRRKAKNHDFVLVDQRYPGSNEGDETCLVHVQCSNKQNYSTYAQQASCKTGYHVAIHKQFERQISTTVAEDSDERGLDGGRSKLLQKI